MSVSHTHTQRLKEIFHAGLKRVKLMSALSKANMRAHSTAWINAKKECLEAGGSMDTSGPLRNPKPNTSMYRRSF